MKNAAPPREELCARSIVSHGGRERCSNSDTLRKALLPSIGPRPVCQTSLRLVRCRGHVYFRGGERVFLHDSIAAFWVVYDTYVWVDGGDGVTDLRVCFAGGV